jgi:hypothetical protein
MVGGLYDGAARPPGAGEPGVSGSRTYESRGPVPVITGGAVSGVTIPVATTSCTATGKVAGSMTRSDTATLSVDAVAIAALIRQDTGTIVARQVIVAVPHGAVAFSVSYDPGVRANRPG